jgi:hypothetical protein
MSLAASSAAASSAAASSVAAFPHFRTLPPNSLGNSLGQTIHFFTLA